MIEKETVEIKTLKFYRNKLEDYLTDYILEKGYEYEAPYIKKDDILEILDTFKQKKILQDKLDKIKEYCNTNRGYIQGYGYLYDFEELQDKVLKLQKDNQELKRIVEAYKDKEDKIRDYLSNTEFEERTAYDKSFCEGVYNTKEKALKILNEGGKE